MAERLKYRDGEFESRLQGSTQYEEGAGKGCRSNAECTKYLDPTVYGELIYSCHCNDLSLVFITCRLNAILSDLLTNKL